MPFSTRVRVQIGVSDMLWASEGLFKTSCIIDSFDLAIKY